MRKEATRHARFCQFRQQIRGSTDYLIVGIDVAKERHHAFLGTSTGRTLLKRLVFENNASGFARLIERAEQMMRQFSLAHSVYGLEPTGNYHKPLANWLIDQEQLIALVSNKSIADNRQTLDGRWDKNDTKDSANVADLLAQGKCQFYEQPDTATARVRSLLSLRRRLKKDEHRLRMQVRNGLVCRHFPELDRFWGKCIQENMAIVRWCLDPRQIARMRFNQFCQRVTSNNRGLKQQQRLRSIYDAAATSVGVPMTDADQYEAQLLAEQLLLRREQIHQVMEKIGDACQGIEHYRLLKTIPGFGPYIAAVVMSRIGNPWRFNGRKQLLRLAGMDLNAKRSGKRSRHAVPVLSKRGNAELRYGLCQAAQIATRRNGPFRELFTQYIENRQKEPGIWRKMRVKIAAKMLVMAWAMMKTNTEFDGNMLNLT